MKKLTIAIPNYNGGENLRSAISSCKHIKLDVNEYEILVVDNKSEDDSISIIDDLKKDFENIVLIQNKNNIGRIQNWNVCLENANSKYLILLFTNDTISIQNNIPEIINVLDEDESISLCISALIRNEDGRETVKRSYFDVPVKCDSRIFANFTLDRGMFPFGTIESLIYRTADIKTTDNKFLEQFPINADEIFSYKQALLRKRILFNPHPLINWNLVKSRFHTTMKYQDLFMEHFSTAEKIHELTNLQINFKLFCTYRLINFLKFYLKNQKNSNCNKIMIFLFSKLRQYKIFFGIDSLFFSIILGKIKNSKYDADDLIIKALIERSDIDYSVISPHT